MTTGDNDPPILGDIELELLGLYEIIEDADVRNAILSLLRTLAKDKKP